MTLITGPSLIIGIVKGFFEIDSDGYKKKRQEKVLSAYKGHVCKPVKKLWSSGGSVGDKFTGQHINSKKSKNRVNNTQVIRPLEKTKEEEEEEEGNGGGLFEIGIPATFTKPLRKARSKVIPPDFSEADLQERWSVRSSISGASSVFGSQTSISNLSSTSSGYGSLASIPELTGSPATPMPLRKARSKDIPLHFSEADLQERWSLRSSISGASSVFGSQKSSGYGSLASIPEYAESSEPKRRKLPDFLRKMINVKDNEVTWKHPQ